jgi:hypothetical protein
VTTTPFQVPRAEALDPPIGVTAASAIATARVDEFDDVHFADRGRRFVELDATLTNPDLFATEAKAEYFSLVAGDTSYSPVPTILSTAHCDGFFDDLPPLGVHRCALVFDVDAGAGTPILVFADGSVRTEVPVALPGWPARDPTGKWTVTFESAGATSHECTVDLGQRVAATGTTIIVAGTCRDADVYYDRPLDAAGTYDPATGQIALSSSYPSFFPPCRGSIVTATVTGAVAPDATTFAGTFGCTNGTTGTFTGTRSP